EELQARIEEFTVESDKVAKEREDKELEVSKIREASHGVARKEAELKREIGHLRQHLENLKFQKQDGARRFGPKVPEVLAAIEREQRWRVKPIGPIGIASSSTLIG